MRENHPAPEDYALSWDYNYAESLLEDRDTRLMPVFEGSKADPLWGANWDEDQGGGEFPNSFFFYLPRICNHCTRPACLEACPRNAIYKREGGGIELVDHSLCRGYQACIKACP